MMNEEARLDPGQLNEYLGHEDGEVVFRHVCKLGLASCPSAWARPILPVARPIGLR
jgi:hypothetical protein